MVALIQPELASGARALTVVGPDNEQAQNPKSPPQDRMDPPPRTSAMTQGDESFGVEAPGNIRIGEPGVPSSFEAQSIKVVSSSVSAGPMERPGSLGRVHGRWTEGCATAVRSTAFRLPALGL